jgi:nitrite reductase/ring-hydroxylating ferredoxin subunit
MSRFVRVASRSELPEGRGHCVEVEGRRVAIFRVGGRYYALGDDCTHMGGPLSEGQIEGEEVECPWHGARFDLRTGESTGPPAEEPVARYPVRVTGEEVEIEI